MKGSVGIAKDADNIEVGKEMKKMFKFNNGNDDDCPVAYV